MIQVKNSTQYYINERALTFSENDLDDPNRVAVSLVSGTVILVHVPGTIDYASDGNYERWTLRGYSTLLVNPEAHYIYARLSRTDRTALIVFSVKNYNIDGSITTVTGADENGNDITETSDPSADYFFVRIGELTATDGTSSRELTYDSGLLSTKKGESMTDPNDMWELLPGVTPLIRAKHWLTSFTVKGFIKLIGSLIFQNSKGVEKPITDIKRSVDSDEEVPISDTNVFTSEGTKKFVEEQLGDMDKRFLSKLHDDRTPYKLNVGDLFTAEKDARLQGKTEADDVTVNEAVHSKEFISGFTGGKGWAIRLKEYLNSAGVTEKRAVAEFDDVIVRGVLRVFEFVISQMLGENDNRTFTGMMEVDHFDPETGRVWLDTQDGRLYNTFRKDDIILVQQYNGMPSEENDFYITKQYELIIDEVGVGDLSLGEDRLDWVTFRNFASPMEGAQVDIITKGDTFVRIDNLTDPNRKGIIQIMTVGEDTPYMDVIYGAKTDPDNSVKARFGNLQAIQNPLFGWLKDFGAYIANLYAVGEFRIAHTGEDVADKIEMVKGAFRTNFSRTYFEMKDGDNHLMNGSFGGDLEGWTLGESSTDFLTVDGVAIYANRNLMTANTKFVGRSVYNDKNMLRILNSDITQPNASIQKFGTHKEFVPMDGSEEEPSHEYVDVRDKAYLIMRFFCDGDGTVEVGFDNGDIEDGSLSMVSMDVVKRTDEYLLQAEGTWNNEGNFVIRSTADIYVEFVTLTDRPLENLTTTTETWMEQDAGRIALLGQKIDKANGSISYLGIELDATNEELRLYANKTDANTSSISQLKIDVDSIDSAVVSVQGDAEEAKELAEAAENLAITATMTGMYSGEEYNQTSNPWLSWPTDTEYMHVGAIWYNPNTGVTKRYVGTDGSNSWETVTDAEEVYASATYVFQNKNKWSAIAAQFDEDGEPLFTSGFVTTGNFATMFSEALGTDPEDLVVRAEISVFITEDEVNGKISNIRLTADNVDINNGVVMIDKDSATIGGFTINSDSISGGDSYIMTLYPDDDNGYPSIRWSNGSTLYASLGVEYASDSYMASGFLNLRNASGETCRVTPRYTTMDGSNGSIILATRSYTINAKSFYDINLILSNVVKNYRAYIGIDSSGYTRIGGKFYKDSTKVDYGELWVDNDGYIKLRE